MGDFTMNVGRSELPPELEEDLANVAILALLGPALTKEDKILMTNVDGLWAEELAKLERLPDACIDKIGANESEVLSEEQVLKFCQLIKPGVDASFIRRCGPCQDWIGQPPACIKDFFGDMTS